uniref:Uncharacterized protein n=1 Tax=Ixodes ricinus TaxID=34613 RepID=A0A6B0TV83_IXORI
MCFAAWLRSSLTEGFLASSSAFFVWLFGCFDVPFASALGSFRAAGSFAGTLEPSAVSGLFFRTLPSSLAASGLFFRAP